MTEDRRSSYRCTARRDDDVAVIRTKRRDLVVRVVEESAGGIAIHTTQPNLFAKGDLLSIAHNATCFGVRVVHITDLEDRAKIGMERLGELKYLHSAGLLHGVSVRDAVVAICLLLLLGAGLFFGWRSAPDDWKASLLGQAEPPAPIIVEQTPEELLAAKYLRLSDARSEKFTTVLDLSKDQQIQINKAINTASRSISQLYSSRKSENDTEWINSSLDLIQQTWLQIENTMQPEQQAKFHRMLRDAESHSQQMLHASTASGAANVATP